ncbi:pyridoxal-phosphate dependent enzyme [Rhodobacteraceae bacterium D3-12]|nr:pyridoxal-phosphate dependent enzyme [Rhodobacteraceae bacterium D3-12]
MIDNPFRGAGMGWGGFEGIPVPSVDVAAARAVMRRQMDLVETPLLRFSDFAGAGEVFVKDERGRLGLGSFKALGAAYVIARDHEEGRAQGQTYVCASAGNHGLSVTAGAVACGAVAVIYLSESVPESFAERLRGMGAEVVRAGATYEESMAAAAEAAAAKGWVLLSDSSWAGYVERPYRVMEGYVVLAAETVEEMGAAPTHIFLQAGVGGLAGACAAYFRAAWGEGPRIVVVEPEAAAALADSIEAGRAVVSSGPVSNMGRLDCKEPSLIALNGLARDADGFVLISEAEAEEAMPVLAEAGLETSPSGGAGLAALLAMSDLGPDARVLCILSEGPA